MTIDDVLDDRETQPGPAGGARTPGIDAVEPFGQSRQVFARNAGTLIGDADQLTQVLQNLLDNAVKYGREGGTVRLDIATAPAGRPGVVMTVADQGAGIPREHLPRLTERFYRVDTGRSRAAGGTGLGLAIVKHIVNRHRGVLDIDSTLGEGSTFTVYLPPHGGREL
jgi:two-component system phosphate regulon sensor histidine kinase PhoR